MFWGVKVMSENDHKDIYSGSRTSRLFGKLAVYCLVLMVFFLLVRSWSNALIAFGAVLLFSWIGYRAAGGAQNPALYAGPPPMPAITNESAVVDWFLRYDPKLSDVRNYLQSAIPELRTQVLYDLAVHNSPFKLKAHIDNLTAELVQLIEDRQKGQELPCSDFGVNSRASEVMLAARLRILGYFLLKKYGIDPSMLEG